MNADAVLNGRESALQVLDQFERGISINDQAKALGVHYNAIYRHLLRHTPELWLEYQAANALGGMDSAERQLIGATDGVGVSRARELGRFAMWRLERAARKYYGADAMQVTINNIALDPAAVALQVSELEERLGLSQACHAQPLTLEHESNQALTETM